MQKPVFLLFDFLGGGELFVIALAVLLLFGGKGMPNLMRNFGRGIRQFKDATNGIQRDIEENINTMKEDLKKQSQIIEEKTKHTD